MTVVLGLTGSIGMGKSTTTAMFAEAGIPVWDADASVHRLYAPGGAAVEPVRALHPQAVRDGRVDREALKDWIAADPTALARLEAVVHPLVAADRLAFLEQTDADVVLLDVPLLLESGGAISVDRVVVVTAPAEVQRARVLARPGMTVEAFDRLLDRQMSDADKRARADYIVETTTLEEARRQVHNILRDVRGEK